MHKIKHFQIRHQTQGSQLEENPFLAGLVAGEGPLEDQFFPSVITKQFLLTRHLAALYAVDQSRASPWASLRALLDLVTLFDGLDSASLSLEASSTYSISSMYAKLSQGVKVAHFKDI